MQRFEIIGRIGKELELRVTNSNKKVVEFSIADTEKINGEDITTWMNCIAWEGKAETLCKYVKKGDMIYLEGKIRNQKYTSKEGQERTKTFLLINNFTLLPNAREKQENEPIQDNWTREPDLSNLGMDMKELDFY